jgi:hypothetical protein
MGKFKEGLAMTAAAAGIVGGTGYGLDKMMNNPTMDKAHSRAMVENQEQTAKNISGGLRAAAESVDRDLKNEKLLPADREKLEIQKKAFSLAIQALEGEKVAPQEQK